MYFLVSHIGRNIGLAVSLLEMLGFILVFR